jgi:predicted nucleic acid-binding protein
MAAFAVDVSACMPWRCEDEGTPASEELLRRAGAGDWLHVPSLWPWEIVNAVSVAARRGRISASQAADFLGLLSDLSFEIAIGPGIADLPRIYTLAARNRLTAYDAAYLDLAIRLALPLATLDSDLKKGAIAERVAVL